MSGTQGNKVKTSIALNVYLRDRAKALVDGKQFASIPLFPCMIEVPTPQNALKAPVCKN